MTSGTQIRKSVSEISVTLHRLGFVANHDGNVSHRSADKGRFFITPTAVSKRLCAPDTIVECEADGAPVGRGRPPSEVQLHVGAYRARPDANACIHAHPPYASAFALAQKALGPVTMPEVVVSLGEHIPLVPMFLPKDAAAAAAVGEALRYADVALLAGNGVISIGPDLETAYLRLELVEHYAKILSVLRGGVGEPAPLDAAQKAKLLEMRKKAGLHRGPERAEAQQAASLPSTLRSVVAEEIERALGGRK